MKWTPHPLLEIPSDEEIIKITSTEEGKESLLEWYKAREAAIKLEKENPVKHGFVLPAQQKVRDILAKPGVDEVWVMGGHRSGKSHSAAAIVVEAMIENPGTRIMCWSQNERTSIQRQQPYIWDLLPSEYKTKRYKEQVAFINYSKGSGFTRQQLILPNGSACYFYYYSQFQNDDSVAEGEALGCLPENCGTINIGVWMDEYLGTDELVKRMRSRCMENNAKILPTFTPMRGYTPTVAEVMDDAITKESSPASLLDGIMMPVVQKCLRGNAYIVFYHSEHNPFSNFERLRRDLKGQPEHYIRKIAYGYPTKSMTAMFTTFDTAVHVFDPEEEKYDFKNTKLWTTYQFIDPAGTRAWANIWCSVNKKGDIRIWAEYPDRQTYGDWAEEAQTAKRDGESITWKVGESARDLAGLSFQQMKIEWDRIEDGIDVFERVIDSRFAHNPRSTLLEGTRCLQDDLHDIGIDVVAADGGLEDEGIALIQQLLSYDDSLEYCPYTNSPRLRISADCGNVIFCLQNYCKNGKKDEPLKDFIDLLRYMARHEGGEPVSFIERETLGQTRGTAGY